MRPSLDTQDKRKEEHDEAAEFEEDGWWILRKVVVGEGVVPIIDGVDDAVI